jgi:hypothetical protein
VRYGPLASRGLIPMEGSAPHDTVSASLNVGNVNLLRDAPLCSLGHGPPPC